MLLIIEALEIGVIGLNILYIHTYVLRHGILFTINMHEALGNALDI